MYPSGCVLGRITRNQTLLQTHRKFLWILEAWMEEITGGNRGQAEKKKKGVERITTFVKLYSNGSLESQRTNSILTLMPQACTLHAVYSCFQCLEVLGYTRTILNQSLLQTSQWVLGFYTTHGRWYTPKWGTGCQLPRKSKNWLVFSFPVGSNDKMHFCILAYKHSVGKGPVLGSQGSLSYYTACCCCCTVHQ